MLVAMADEEQSLPVIVRMRVNCAQCGHTEDETYEFDMLVGKAEPMEERAPGKCPECGAPIRIHLRRVKALQ
jgi:hypothetical protein